MSATPTSTEFSNITSPIKATLIVLDQSDQPRDVYSSQAAEYIKELSNAVDDSKHAVVSLHEEVFALAQEWRGRWSSWCENNIGIVNKFDTQYMHPTQIGFTTRTVDEQLGMSLTTDWIRNYAENLKLKVPSSVESFDELFRGINHLGKKNDITAFLHSLVKSLFPLDGFGLVDSVVEVHDLQHADPFALIKAEFSRSFTVLSRLEAQTAQALEEKEACIRSEDVRGAEQRSVKAIETLVSALQTAYERHKSAMATTAEIAQYHANVAQQVHHASECVDRATFQTVDIQTNVTADLTKLRTFHEAKVTEDAASLSRYETNSQQFRDKVYENTKKQMSVWDRILADLRTLRNLCDERDELIVEHQHETAVEQQRRQLQREVVASCDVREQQLQLILANTANATDFLANCRDYIGKGNDAITRANLTGKLEKLQLEEGLRCYGLYRNYTIQSNTVLFRRDQRLENVRRLLRSTQFQLNTAIETMDTDLNLYKEQVRTLGLTEAQLAQHVEQLKGEIDEQQTLWAPVGEFLELRQAEVDPPSLIAQELRRDLMVAHVTAVDELTNNEQKLLDNEKALVRKIYNACEAAKETYKEKVDKSHH